MIKNSNHEVEILKRQSLADVTIQQTGNMEAIFEIAENNECEIDGDLIAGGDPLRCNIINNKPIADYFRINNVRPATSITLDEIRAILNKKEGIDYWIVEDDFVVMHNELIINN